MSNLLRIKPEVMSPAGYWPQLRAAIEAGADAVYFGLQHFSARAKVGFTLTELPEVIRELHARGVKGYVTFNTLVFEHELQEAAKTLAAIAAAGADSIIVQDLGIARLASEIAPGLAIHGSTQMSITSAEGVELAKSLGVSRVVLARELSLEEIRAIRAATELELEMFVHGALCVSYSGQCFSSEAWGGRSANRGQCAQACRLSYDLIVDDRQRPLGDARYLLSPGDLYALHEVPDIVECGISALKIEGRYKDAEYVALATDAYRKAIDAAWENRKPDLTPADEMRLEQAYSRGFGPYFVKGTDHQAVVRGRAPRHRGVQIGRVVEVLRAGVRIEPAAAAHAVSPLKPGDGLVFDAADWRSPNEKEEGGHVFSVKAAARGKNLDVEFGNDAVDFSRIRPGDIVWRTHDPELARAVRPLLEAMHRKQPVEVDVRAHAGEPLTTTWRVGSFRVDAASPAPLETAQNQGLTPEKLREQFERLGNTPYALGMLRVDIKGNPFAPASLLNQIRREASEQLAALQTQAKPAELAADPADAVASALSYVRRTASTKEAAAQMHLLVRTPEQLEAALQQRPASITLDYLELYGLKPSIDRIKASGIAARVASPRVLKPSEQRIVHFLLKLECPILVRSGGLLQALRTVEPCPELIGDFSLNAANAISASILIDLGLSRFTPTYDLNADQIARVARDAGADRIEAVAYQHLPVFHTEHCVFCRFLSTGTSYKDCGHPCEKHKVALRDQQGREHPVMADVGCRNTVFGAEAQEASLHLDRWRAAGIGHFRLEFVHESAAQVTAIASAFADALAGRIGSKELYQRWKRISPQGVTEGSLFVPNNYMTLPVLQ